MYSVFSVFFFNCINRSKLRYCLVLRVLMGTIVTLLLSPTPSHQTLGLYSNYLVLMPVRGTFPITVNHLF